MRCESEPLPSNKHRRNCSYILKKTKHFSYFTLPPSMSIWRHVLGPTLLVTYWNPPSALCVYKVFILVELLHTLQLLPVASSRTLLSEKSLLPPMPLPPRLTPTPRRFSSLMSFLQSVFQYCDEILVALSSSHPYPPSFLSHTGALPGLPPYIISQNFIGAPVLSSTFATIPHIL